MKISNYWALLWIVLSVSGSQMVWGADISPAEKDQLEKSAAAGDADAQLQMGEYYLHGDGGEVRAEDAAKLLEKAAKQGVARAQCLLGHCYREGIGVTRNQSEALKWFTAAAVQGDATGQCLLGRHHEKGEGGAPNIEEAVKWYCKSSDQNFRKGYEGLVRCYDKLAGTTKEEVRGRLEKYLSALDTEQRALLRIYVADRTPMNEGRFNDAYRRMTELQWKLYPAKREPEPAPAQPEPVRKRVSIDDIIDQ